MRFKLTILIILIGYIFYDSIVMSVDSSSAHKMTSIKDRIFIDPQEINVFKEQPMEEVTINESRSEAWLVLISFDDQSKLEIGKKLSNLGYLPRVNSKKRYFSIGPYIDKYHARIDSSRLKQSYGIDNQVVNVKF